MEIELLGTINYKKLEKELSKIDEDKRLEIMALVKQTEIEKRSQIVATAGRLSRFPGDVLEILGITEEKSFSQNISFIKRVIGMGHASITDHDYLVFAIKNVSPVIEQTIIEERFASFTIKSRREVDFSKAGFYTPDFHDKNGNILENNEKIKQEYQLYMEGLFKDYEVLKEAGIPIEDARFVLPYCYYSNIIMGVDAHTLRDMIIKYTKTKDKNIQEIREFGERLKEIAKANIPYIMETIETAKEVNVDPVHEYLINCQTKANLNQDNYQVIDKVKLLNCTPDIDDTILISSIMRRFQLDKKTATKVYQELCLDDENFKDQLMQKIAFEGDGLELSQASFDFQIPLSYAILTHLTRHRTHSIMVPDFVPNIDLTQYKVPPKIASNCLLYYQNIYKSNLRMYNHLKEDYNVCEEDLVYFVLSGNKVNVLTNIDGKTIRHILELRECNKAQWETRGMAYAMHDEIKKQPNSISFSKILGSTCMTQDLCKEGKECCGKILKLRKKNTKN